MISASSVDQYALDDARSPIAFAKVFGIERWVANPLKGACMLEAKYVSVGSYARGSADSHGPRRLTFLVPPCPQHVWEIRSSELSVDSLCQLRLPSFDCTVESARDAWDLQLQSYLRNHRPLPSTVSSNQQGVTAAAETLRFDPEAAFLELNGFSKDADSAATAPSPSLAEMGRHNRAQLLAVERSCLLAAEPDQNADDAAARHHRFCEARETWQHSAFERFRSRVWTGHSVYLSDAQRAIVSHGGATLTSRRLAKSTNNFSLLADWLLRFSISIEEGFGVVADGTLNVVLTFLAALNASDPEPKNKLHALMCGDHAQSKSFTLHVLQSLLIPGVAKSMTYMTNASMAFEGNSNGTVYIFEECPHKMLGVSARGRPSSMNEVETRAKQQLTSGQVTVMELGYSQGKRVSRVSTHTCNTVFVCATNAPFQKMAPAMQSRFLQIHTSGGKNADVIAKICESQTAAQRELKDEVIEISRWLQYHVQLVFLLVDVGILVVDLSLTNATLPRIFAAAARRGLPHAQSVREVERVRCLVRLLVVIRAVLRNLTTTNGVSASHDLRFILNVQRDLSDLADLTVLATAIGLLRTQWQHPAMYAVVKAMRACFPPTPDGRAAAQGMLESHPRTIPAVRSTAAVETVTLNMRTALAAVLLPHIVEHKQSASVRHDDVCAVLAALESTEIHDQHATHPPIVSALRYMPKTGQFALAPPILLNNKRDILLESVQEVLRLCVPTNCDCISIPWPSRTAGDDHFRVVHLRRPAAEEDAKQQTLLGHARKRRRSSSSFRSSVISPATTPVAADQSMQGGLSDSSSKNLYLRWQRRSGVRETVGAEWELVRWARHHDDEHRLFRFAVERRKKTRKERDSH